MSMSVKQQQFSFYGELSGLDTGIDIICGMLGLKRTISGGLPITLERTENPELIVTFKGAGARIVYRDSNHLFRAIGLVVESIRSDRLTEIREEPQFDTIGIMLDCSRNAVPTIESVKELLRYMALMGMNTLMLYTEDTYTVEEEPYFGYMRGRYTIGELQECDAYAAELGIEMIPCIQTLAHLESFLKWQAAANLRDSHDVLLVGQDQTYQLIDRMVDSVSRTFRSRRIHIGMDEAQGLGRGRALDLYGYKNRFELMNEHLSKVKEITANYGLQPLIWSDMYFRIGSETHDYYDLEAVIDDAHANRIPQGTQLVYWDYYHYEQEFYEAMIRRHQELGSVPVFAGGIWTWLGMCTHYTRTLKCSNAALQACKQEGVREVFVTAWGDNGAENNIWSMLPGMQLYAEHAYAKVMDEQKLQQRTSFCTGIPYEHFMNLELLDHIPGLLTEQHGDFSNPSKYLLWQDVLLGLFDKHIENVDLAGHYGRLAELYREQADARDTANHLFGFLACLGDVLKLKADLGLRLRNAYVGGDHSLLEHIAGGVLPELLLKVEALRISHREQWMRTNKPQGWEILDIRYGGLSARLKSAQDRITDYLAGIIERIEELEERRLYFDDRLGHEGAEADYFVSYHLIASANKFT
ncbi:N-acetyl-beta-D-glucosaminidase [Paenibacillus baekrokdamisoli]|uniref:N-acetyl-beta-D-glucosaminidase n=1 Tax=Paenibacillus baekrokdamisoli TaxID=1712516 RepID=A0A3G9JCP7_9BACL|nr:beta-N-acetylhexosaminidase [Paenibacillus baekrokdamisoli]BBH21708.1 N-acetyl-beta-D-glucosaminidase [Paenibacillus baekrokdamisoli]